MRSRRAVRDDGSILAIVLVIVVVLGAIVAALATYAATTLRYGGVVEDSSDRLSAASGGLDNALAELDHGSSPCALTALANNPTGLSYELTDAVNGIRPTITCTAVGGEINAVDAFAVILTGAGAGRTGPLLTITNGGNSAQAEKVFEGPVYMSAVPRDSAPNQSLDFLATLTLKDGDLWYSNPGGCPSADVQLPPQLTIAPAGYTTKCRTETWDVLFGSRKPPEPTVTNPVAFPAATAPVAPDALGCYVWSPGRYTSPPNLQNQSYNYFRSGDYFFDNVGEWTTSNAFVLFGRRFAGGLPQGPGIDGPGPGDTFANNPCRDAWANDTDQQGAALYLGGSSRIQIEQNSTFEVSGRDHSGYMVGIQALETAGVASTVVGDNQIVRTGSGSNKQLSINGLVWAPYASFQFDLISNDAVAALTGGAVVGELSAGASANASNFVISVQTQPSTTSFVFTSTANKGGSTTVRAVVTYRTDRVYAITSRRVIGLTPE